MYAPSSNNMTLSMTMRNYDKLIRFYASWFGDLLDPDKGFTDAEKWQVVAAMAECQDQGNTEPLDNLPAGIKRGLPMATYRTQLAKIIASRKSCVNRARLARSAQGSVPTSRAYAVEQLQAAAERHEQQAKQDAAREKAANEARATREAARVWLASTTDDIILEAAKKGKIEPFVWPVLISERPELVSYMRAHRYALPKYV